MNDSAKKTPLSREQALSILGIAASLLVFAFILYIAYLPNRAGPVDQNRISEREAKRMKNRAEQQAKAAGYEWIDKEQGTLRIPIDQAMALTVEDLEQEK